MGRKKKRKEPSGPPNAPEWIVTFTDMISLLVTFFVLLMTFSSLDSQISQKVDSFLEGTRGIHKAKGNFLPELGKSDLLAARSVERGSNQAHSRPPDKLADNIDEMGQKRTAEHLEMDLNDVADGLVIEFGEEECFDPGSAEVSPALEKSLIEIGTVLENYPHMVVVEGFTDSAFDPTPRYPSEDRLSIARARAATETLLARTNMAPELIQIASHGSRQPRADNESPGGRRLNRRVQLRVLSLSSVRASHLAAQQAGDL